MSGITAAAAARASRPSTSSTAGIVIFGSTQPLQRSFGDPRAPRHARAGDQRRGILGLEEDERLNRRVGFAAGGCAWTRRSARRPLLDLRSRERIFACCARAHQLYHMALERNENLMLLKKAAALVLVTTITRPCDSFKFTVLDEFCIHSAAAHASANGVFAIAGEITARAFDVERFIDNGNGSSSSAAVFYRWTERRPCYARI